MSLPCNFSALLKFCYIPNIFSELYTCYSFNIELKKETDTFYNVISLVNLILYSIIIYHWLILFYNLLYQIIERILDFSRHQIMESMAAFNPLSRSHKPNENGNFDGKIPIAQI